MNAAIAVLTPPASCAMVDPDAYVLPRAVTAAHANPGPRFGEDVWDVAAFVPRTTRSTRIDFTTFGDAGQARTAKEYLYSRIHRAVAANRLSGTARPMKITGLYGEFREVRTILRDLATVGAHHLTRVKTEGEHHTAHTRAHNHPADQGRSVLCGHRQPRYPRRPGRDRGPANGPRHQPLPERAGQARPRGVH
jgi:hypothetical protein